MLKRVEIWLWCLVVSLVMGTGRGAFRCWTLGVGGGVSGLWCRGVKGRGWGGDRWRANILVCV